VIAPRFSWTDLEKEIAADPENNEGPVRLPVCSLDVLQKRSWIGRTITE
jgi:hypothetical protein